MPIRPRSTGLTLLELVVVIAVLTVMTSLAALAVMRGAARVRVSNAAFELSALYAAAQMRASSLGVPHYVVFHEEGTDFGAYLLERPDSLSEVDWAADDVSRPELLGGRLHERLRLSGESGLEFADLASPQLEPRALPAPFSSIPLIPSGSGGLLGGCSFCTTGSGGARGVIRFAPDGTVRVMTGSAASRGALDTIPGGVLGLVPGGQGQPRLIVITAPAGTTRIF